LVKNARQSTAPSFSPVETPGALCATDKSHQTSRAPDGAGLDRTLLGQRDVVFTCCFHTSLAVSDMINQGTG